MKQLKAADMSEVREMLVKRQNGKCVLCERDFKDIDDTACVDHDHTSGQIRAALCRHCNGIAGKIENRANRAKQGLTKLQWLNNFHAYINAEQTELIHPSNAPKAPILQKRLFNKIKKFYPTLTYPVSGRITKRIQSCIDVLVENGDL